MAKYAQARNVRTMIRYRGKHFVLTSIIPENVAYLIYRRLRERFEKGKTRRSRSSK